MFANSRCYLVQPDFAEFSTLFPFLPQSIGLWCFQANNGDNFDGRDIDFGSTFETARALGTTTMVFGWIIWIFYLVAGCVRVSPMGFRIIGLFGVLTCVFQGLVFLVLKSDVCNQGCDLDTGGKCGIAACVFWFLTGTMSCAAGKEKEEAEETGDYELDELEAEIARELED